MTAAQDADTLAALAGAAWTLGMVQRSGGDTDTDAALTMALELHAVSIAAGLSRSAEARNRAEDIDPEETPSRERLARLGVEIARAYYQKRDYPAMLHWLEQGPPDLGGLGALLTDRPADDRRRHGPRRGADQPEGALVGLIRADYAAHPANRSAAYGQHPHMSLLPGPRSARS